MEKDISKRTSSACDVCKRRKGRCSGTNPCNYCTEHGISCSYVKTNKKRGPAKRPKIKANSIKQTESPIIETVSSLESVLCGELERVHLLDIYAELVMPEKQLLTTRKKLLHPTTIVQKMLSNSVMGFMARATGTMPKAELLIAEARSLAGQILEDQTYEAAGAFLALGMYYPATDHRSLLYISIAQSISKNLSHKDLFERRLYDITSIASIALDRNMDYPRKIKFLLEFVPRLINSAESDCTDVCLGVGIRVMTNLMPKLHDFIICPERTVELLTLNFSPSETAVLLADINLIEWLILRNPDVMSKGREACICFKVIKMVVLWRSGDIAGALISADSAMQDCSDGIVRYMLMKDIHFFWILSAFYSSAGYPEKERKAYDMFLDVCLASDQRNIMKSLQPPSQYLRISDKPAFPSKISEAVVPNMNSSPNIEFASGSEESDVSSPENMYYTPSPYPSNSNNNVTTSSYITNNSSPIAELSQNTSANNNQYTYAQAVTDSNAFTSYYPTTKNVPQQNTRVEMNSYTSSTPYPYPSYSSPSSPSPSSKISDLLRVGADFLTSASSAFPVFSVNVDSSPIINIPLLQTVPPTYSSGGTTANSGQSEYSFLDDLILWRDE